jgi:predicted metalloprotease with PDZ domain
MKCRTKFGVFVFILQVLLHVTANSQTNSSGLHYYYQLIPLPGQGITRLSINLKFKVNSDTALLIRLPRDSYGTPDLYKYVTTFSATNGCSLIDTERPNFKKVLPANREISLNYIVSYDSLAMSNFSFGPNTGSNYYHIAGCQWILPIDNLAQVNKYSVSVNLPAGWQAYSSISKNALNFETERSYENMVSTAIGGSALPAYTIYIKDKPVNIFVAGQYKLERKEIERATEKIVRAQRKWVNDYEQNFYTVTILPRRSIVAGTSITNLFVCFIDSGTSAPKLYNLLSHEMFHVWLPNKVRFKLPQGDRQLKYNWFYEGFTEYFARKLMLEEKLVTMEEFVNYFNKDIIDIAENPARHSNYAELCKLEDEDKFMNYHQRIAYYKGSLLAMYCEAILQIRDSRYAVKQIIEELYAVTKKQGPAIDENLLFETGKKYGINFKELLNKHFLQEAPLPVPVLPESFGSKYALIDSLVPKFEVGFDLSASQNSKFITGVDINGTAFKAGLRDGMAFVKAEGISRFSNNFQLNALAKITITENGEEKNILYLPHGEMLLLKLFRKK